jgi:hypothetical protein
MIAYNKAAADNTNPVSVGNAGATADHSIITTPALGLVTKDRGCLAVIHQASQTIVSNRSRYYFSLNLYGIEINLRLMKQRDSFVRSLFVLVHTDI